MTRPAKFKIAVSGTFQGDPVWAVYRRGIFGLWWTVGESTSFGQAEAMVRAGAQGAFVYDAYGRRLGDTN